MGRRGGRFVRYVALDEGAAGEGYPFDLPVVDGLRRAWLTLGPGVTFLVGENGSGKSTLVEGVAVAAGLNAEGGSRSFRFSTRASESALGGALRLGRAPGREKRSFFLRAESFYNVATEIERLALDGTGAYGPVSPHERSHGESFLDLLTHRFQERGLYLLDEPEAALSPTGNLALLRRMRGLALEGAQFVVATHSPVLMAYPGATIHQLGEAGIEQVSYDESDHVLLMRSFMDSPERFLRHLFAD